MLIEERHQKILEILDKNKDKNENENFANGRLMRNMYDDIVMNHAKRVVDIPYISKEELSLIKEEDLGL